MQKHLPVLQLLKKNRKIILIILPRYMCLPCCLEEGHCSNRKERDYLTRLLAGLKEMQRELKEAFQKWRLANYSRRVNYRVFRQKYCSENSIFHTTQTTYKVLSYASQRGGLADIISNTCG
jgi:hypothetical protein